MIAIPLLRSSFGKVAGYNEKNVRERDGVLIFSNVASTDPFQRERELNAVAARRPKVNKCAVHLIVALHPEDASRATPLRFVKWLLQIRQFLGFDHCQTVAWQHFDKKHPHIHMLMNRVPLDGPPISLWGKRRALNEFCSQLAEADGLRHASRREFEADHPHELNSEGSVSAPGPSATAVQLS
jgi:hypothetical protein